MIVSLVMIFHCKSEQEITDKLKQVLRFLPEEQHGKVLAIMQAEPSKFLSSRSWHR